jgi:uncharacterized protein (TIGR02611 family)
MWRWAQITYRHARWLVVSIIGFTVLLLGIVMIVTPGPAFIVIPLGLGILAVEFAWARKLLRRMKEKIQDYTSGSDRAESAPEETDRSDP